ncbi:hypothetical protein [Natranaerobius trueperi]|uniref:Uncharacterized protein n=1 Tax=Natranaerobius trueperi TaxID=759412 RepID=A0A226BXP4_9FIRM|nr:hypothetical protein [Natranaerobius trueperi]OWZ83681.1 hypothetical protein CDO51_06940 [Natranaerobius trueperi]
MIDYKDKITIGIVAGILANIIKNIVGIISCVTGLKEYHIWQFATSAILPVEKINTLSSILGAFTDFLLASMLGVIAVYFIFYVGFENYILKGILIGGFAWISIFIVAVRLEISRLDPNTVSGSFAFLFNHLLLGILIVYFIKTLGKNTF